MVEGAQRILIVLAALSAGGLAAVHVRPTHLLHGAKPDRAAARRLVVVATDLASGGLAVQRLVETRLARGGTLADVAGCHQLDHRPVDRNRPYHLQDLLHRPTAPTLEVQ